MACQIRHTPVAASAATRSACSAMPQVSHSTQMGADALLLCSHVTISSSPVNSLSTKGQLIRSLSFFPFGERLAPFWPMSLSGVPSAPNIERTSVLKPFKKSHFPSVFCGKIDVSVTIDLLPGHLPMGQTYLLLCLSHPSSQGIVTQACQDGEMEVPSLMFGTYQGPDNWKEGTDLGSCE